MKTGMQNSSVPRSAVAACLLLAGLHVSGASGQEGVYELRCRGGGDGFGIGSPGPFPPDGGPGTLLVVSLDFSPGPRAVGVNGLGLDPGTCAWIDRPVNAAEPRRIHFEVPARAQDPASTPDLSPTAAERYADARTIAAYLSQPHHYWSFFVHNTNRGYFQTIRHRFWRAGTVPPRWTVEAGHSGGIAGAGIRVTATADGQVIVEKTGQTRARCTAKLLPGDRKDLENAVAQARVEAWQPKYVAAGNPHGCCDMFQSSLRMQQESPDSRRTDHATTWNSDSGNRVPPDATYLFKVVLGLRKVCQMDFASASTRAPRTSVE